MTALALSVLLFQAPTPIAEMDFDFYNHLIHVPVTVNGHKTEAVLDTGAGGAVMDLALAEKWKLDSAGQVQASGIGKDRITGKLLTNATVEFAGIKTPVRVAIPLDPIAHMAGRPLNLVLGFELFSKYVVEVDYAKRHLRFFEADTDFGAKGVAVPVHFVQNHIHVSSNLTITGKNYPVESLVDTGAAGSGGLTARFLAQHPIEVKKTPKSVIGGGVGGVVEGSMFRPDSLELAGTSFAKPVLSLNDSTGGASGATSAYDLLIGEDVLSRFRLTIDYPHKRLIFEPGAGMQEPFEADKTGLRLMADGADLHTIKVVGLLPGSTSEGSGLKIDDVIEAIDGKPASQMELGAIREMFRARGAESWNLDVRRGTDHLKIKLQAKSII